MNSGLVDLTENVPLAIVRLNRPDKLNALNHAMMDDLREISLALRERQDIRGVLFLGNGRSFCAGQDLKEPGIDGSAIERLAREFRDDFQSAIAGLPQPTIAAVHGHVLGRGLMLALACDIRIAASNVKAGFPEVKFGIVPGGGGSQRLAKIVGSSRAIHMVLTGEQVDADTALQWGLVTKIVPNDELEVEAINLAREIASLPGSAGIFSKVTIGVASGTSLSEGVKFEKALSAVLTGGADWKRERERFNER